MFKNGVSLAHTLAGLVVTTVCCTWIGYRWGHEQATADRNKTMRNKEGTIVTTDDKGRVVEG